MKKVICPALLFLLIGCYRDGRGVVIGTHDIPGQAVIQGSDVEMANASHYKPKRSTVRDSRDVVGHVALHPIPKGEPLDRSEVN